ncbi:MAG: hypothetical protein DRP87_10165 [Spirochaetes bacterium]|mgnify:CR=1 FL=1|nr:MAG: hypothetical protein DRP87_10165 [Spirochaetota bacterium]
MDAEKARKVTRTAIFLPDTFLNWIIGIVFIISPEEIDSILGSSPLLPQLFYIAMGIGFLLFALWQSWVLLKGSFNHSELVIAGLLAVFPAALLATALIKLDLDLRPTWRIVLWASAGYMTALGAWYLFLAEKLREMKSS